MRILNSILLFSLFFTGLAVHFQSTGSHNSENLHKFGSVQQHLMARNSDRDIARRGSGRIETEASS